MPLPMEGAGALYPTFDLIPDESPLSDNGKWAAFARPPLKVGDDGLHIHGTQEFVVNGSVYMAKVFEGAVLEAYGCRPDPSLGAANESHRIVALIGNPAGYTGYAAGYGGGIGEFYFFRRYDGDPASWDTLVETGGPGPDKLGIRLTPTTTEMWSYYTGAWNLIHSSGDVTHRGATWFSLETEEQGGIEEVVWTCFGAGIINRTQIYRLVQGQKASV